MKRLSLQGLQPGTDYSVQVRSVLQGETSEWSQSLDFTTTLDYNPPLDITGLLWQSKGTSWLATWNHIDQSGAVPQNNDFSHYEVRVTYSGTNVVYTTQNDRLEFTLEQNISSFGQPRNPLSVAVRTVDVSGNAGNWVSHASVSNPAPGAPSSISATQGIERIALAWSPPSDSDIDYYRVYTSASSGGTYTLAASPRTNSFVYETTSTAMVYFRVFTVDIFGTESTTYASANQQAKPSSTPDTTPPAAPTAVTVTPGFDSIAQQAYVDIAWTNPTASDLNVANIRYGNNGSTFSYLTLAATSAAAQTHRLNVAAGSSVYVGVQAQDFAGNKSAYTNASVYPVTAAADTTAPSQPAAPSVTGGNMIAFVSHNGNKQAGGAMEADVARYEVHASTTSGFTASTSTMIGSINASSVAGSSFPIAATKANPTWYFRVVAVDRSGNRSPVSNQTTATINVINDSNINQTILDSITEAQGAASDANAIADLGYVLNPTFSAWTGTAPVNWANETGTPVKETTIRRTGPNALRYNLAAATNGWISQSTTIPDVDYITIEADIYLVSGTLQGSGILARYTNTAPASFDTLINFNTEIPNVTTGKWYRITKTIKKPSNYTGTFSSFRVFPMGGYPGFGTIAAKNIIFDRVTAWPATDGEIRAYNAATQQSVTEINLAANDLVLNGSAQDGTNKYFEAFILDTTDAPAGAKASFKAPTTASSTLIGSQIIPIDPTKKYKFSLKARQTVPGTGSANTLYGALAPHDAFGMAIFPYHYMYQANTTTTLAADLKPGDTVMQLTSAANWNNAAGASTHLRSAIFWNFVDAGGRVWPEHTYSRNWSGLNFYADGGISGNNVTLSVPYAGTLVPAGTKVSNGSSGGNYLYSPAFVVVPETWTEYSGIIGGVHSGGSAATFASGFPPGCVAVKVGVLANYSTGGGRHAVAAFSLSDASAAQATADTALSTANGKNKVTHSTSTPGSSANSVGDVWYQYNGSNQVIGFWRGVGGTSWTAQTLENVVIATMDAAKINTGILNADRIGAKTLSTNKLLVSDMTNLLDDPDFIDSNTFGKNWIDMSGGGGWSVVTGEAGAGKALTTTALNGTQRRTANSRATRVRAGDAFVITTRYAHNVAGSTPYIALMYRNAAGTVVATQTISLPATAGAWTTLASSQQIVPNTAGIETVHYEFTISSTATSGGVLTVQNPKFLRAANGELIVDGAITAQKVGTNEIIANTANIKDGVITNAKIANATITSAKIESLKADKLEAGSGVVSELIVKDGIDPLTGLASTGVIRSDNYNAVARTGFKLDKNKLDLFEGAVDAKTINLRNSFNIMPASMATFESRRDFYQENMLLSNCNVDVSTEAAVGDQALQITTTGTNWSATLGTAPNIVLEPNRKYILSFLAKGSTGTENLKARLSYSETGDDDAPLPTEIIDVTLGTDYPATPYHTVISNLTNEIAFVKFEGPSAGKQITIDCVQVEEQVGSLTTPSRWQPPSFTSITGGQISTGSIQSQDTSSGRPAWSIDLEGDAIFSSAKILGSLTVGEGSEDTSYIQSGNYGEVVGDIVKGWKINADGTAEFNSATMRGKATLNSAEIIGSLSVVKRSESEVGSVELNPDTVTTIYGNLTSPPAPQINNTSFDAVALGAPSSGVDPKTRQNRSGPATDASGNIYVGYTYDDSSAGITYLGVSKYNSAGVWQAENIVEVDGELGLPKIIGFNHVTSSNTLFVMLDTGTTGDFNPIYTFSISNFANAPTESYIEYDYQQIRAAYRPWVYFTGSNYYWAYSASRYSESNIINNPRMRGTISSNWSVARGYASTTLTAGSGAHTGELIISSNTSGSAIKGAVPDTTGATIVNTPGLYTRVYAKALVNPTSSAVQRARIRINWSNGTYSYSDNFMMSGDGTHDDVDGWQEISFNVLAKVTGAFQVEFYFDGDSAWGSSAEVGRIRNPSVHIYTSTKPSNLVYPPPRQFDPIYGDGSLPGWSWTGTPDDSSSISDLDEGRLIVEKRSAVANQLGTLVSMQLSDMNLYSDITGLYVGNGDYTGATNPNTFAITRKQSNTSPGNYYGLTYFAFVNSEPADATPVPMVARESAFGNHNGICWNTSTGKFNLLNSTNWTVEEYTKMYSSNGISVAITHYSSSSGRETLMSPITTLSQYYIRQRLTISGLVPPSVPLSVPSADRPTGYRVYLGTADATDRTKMQRVLTTTGWPTSIDIKDNTAAPRGTAPSPILVPGTYTATAATPPPATNGFGGATGFTPAVIKSSNDVFTVDGMGAGRISGLSFSENGLVLDAGISGAAGKITTNTGGFVLNHNGTGKIAGFDFTASQISSTTGGLYFNSDGTGAMPMMVQYGTESITPVANDPTSKTVTFPVAFPAGATIRVFTTPNTAYPYSSVRLTSVTDQTNTSFKLWIYRVNNTSTQINWVAYASY